MPKAELDANAWLRENDPNWGRVKQQHGGHLAKFNSCKKKRLRRAKMTRENRAAAETIKAFVERNRGLKSAGCLFVPAAQKNVPASLKFCDKNISAARYMCLLTHGTPPTEGMVVRHLCGNGHLSCVNPAHVVWGTQGQNIADATKHRTIGDDATEHDRINAVTPN